MHTTSLLALAARLLVSMAVVIAVMWGAARLMRGRGGVPSRRRTAAPIEVLARQAFGRSASVAVVRAGGRALVLGVTDTSVTLLAEADPSALDAPDDLNGDGRTPPLGPPGPGPAWKLLLDTLRERTVRRS